MAESVTVRPMPAGLVAAARTDPPTLALCLQLAPPQGGFPAWLATCSLAANFGARDQENTAEERRDWKDTVPEGAGSAGVGGGLPAGATVAVRGGLPVGATVAVIRPVPLPRTPAVWRPSLGHLVGLALREAALSPARLRDRPIVLSLYARLPAREGLCHLFHPILPAGGYPRWLRLRVPDFAGRVYAVTVWAQDLTPALGHDGMETFAAIVRPLLGADEGETDELGADEVETDEMAADEMAADELETNKGGAPLGDMNAAGAPLGDMNAADATNGDVNAAGACTAAREARLALYFTLEVQHLQVGGRPATLDDV